MPPERAVLKHPSNPPRLDLPRLLRCMTAQAYHLPTENGGIQNSRSVGCQVGLASALHRAARCTPDEVLLEEDHENDDRHGVEHRAGEHPVPVHAVKSLE